MDSSVPISLLIHFPLELLTAVMVYMFGLQKRKKFWLRSAVSFCCWILGIFVFYRVLASVHGRGGESRYIFLLIFLLIFAALTVFIYFVCNIRIREALYCATIAYLTEHIVYCIRNLVNFISNSVIADPGTIYYLFIHIIVYLCAYYFFAKRMIHDGHYHASAIQSLGVSVSTLFLVVFMSLVASIYNFIWIHSIYAMFGCFVVLLNQVNQLDQLNLQKELDVREQLWIKHKAQYEMSEETIEIINRKCHDWRHQVLALRLIDDLEEQKEAIMEVEKSIQVYESIVKTGNEILDTLLTEKSLIGNKNHIQLNCMIDGKLLAFMEVIDIYSLFGNAIDNAMEGVMKLDSGEDRSITLWVTRKLNLIIIRVENRFHGTIKQKNGLPVTDKEDLRYHGFGMKSMLHIAEKYGGVMKVNAENHIFTLTITIPEIP
ncbi:MAG: ATP-binding protein [Lachnospiraceae bacterium]